jgi:AcrR family transcriptional regulator
MRLRRERRRNRLNARSAGGPDGASPTRARVSESPGLPKRLSPRKRPRQDRAQATVDAVLGAAADLLASRGYAGTSTNAIAARAGVAIGSLYQYFPNKDAILLALFERHLEGIERIVVTSLAEIRDPLIPLEASIRRMFLALLAMHDADPAATRALDLLAAGSPPGVDLMRLREGRFRSALVEALDGRRDVCRTHGAATASLLFDLVEAATKWLTHGDARRFDREQALATAVDMICRSLKPLGPRAQSLEP